ncbi:MAG: PD-(D/E)XK nuclease family protein [Alphaproteobacteria bacterium]
MSNILSIPPGPAFAEIAAAHLLETLGGELPRAVVFVPNRRAGVTLRDGFTAASNGRPLLLPRILPLGDIDDELLLLLRPDGPAALASLSPAMSDWQRLCLLASQVRAFARSRLAGAISLEQALRLAGDLAQLQDRFTRAGIRPTMAQLEALVGADFATHWRHALEFLAIAFAHWPDIERDYGTVTQAAREIAAFELLTDAWSETPPGFPIYAVGSTASQPATARLLRTIAGLPGGGVILPGLDASLAPDVWETVAPGHPYFHLKSFLDLCGAAPGDVRMLAVPAPPSRLWLEVLVSPDAIAGWRDAPPLAPETWEALRLVACAHPEEEARVIALLMREAADGAERTALVTPDETLMQRVALHLKRWNVTVDRVAAGTLADTECGTLLAALLGVMLAPDRMLPLLSLLRHKLVRLAVPNAWTSWLAQAEPALRGVVTTAPGRLPAKIDAGNVTDRVARLLRQLLETGDRAQSASAWATDFAALLGDGAPEAGEGAEAIAEILAGFAAADVLGPLELEAFAPLLATQLEAPWRQPLLSAHPNLAMLTPVEARLQHFDRVILGNLQARLWPGLSRSGPWLNLAQQEALGLPAPQEAASLAAHDLLMLGSAREVFLTWPLREGGAQVPRSPYIERLVARLALQGIAEDALAAPDYLSHARALYEAEAFAPEAQPFARPSAAQRPRELPVSALDDLFRDPYRIYARHVLGLKPLDEIDAEPEALDFGSLAHGMLKALGDHWSREGRAPDGEAMEALVEQALAKFSGRPGIALFWRDRLKRALAFVNAQEEARRCEVDSVAAEMSVKRAIEVAPGESLTLTGRIDRLETTGGIEVIADYKTGRIPTKKEIGRGEAVQLLAYALLREAEGADVAALEYWKLPRAGAEAEIEALPVDETAKDEWLPALKAALASMLDPATPFLARPTGGEERFEDDYAGISRYDEWAG